MAMASPTSPSTVLRYGWGNFADRDRRFPCPMPSPSRSMLAFFRTLRRQTTGKVVPGAGVEPAPPHPERSVLPLEDSGTPGAEVRMVGSGVLTAQVLLA